MLELEKLNQLTFAQRCGLSHSTITRFVQGRQPTPELLAHLCSKWDDRQHGLEMLRAHLLDEIERSGRGLNELHISFSRGRGDLDLDRAIEILTRESELDAELRATLLDFSRMIERHRQRNVDSLRAVAEDQAPFASMS